MCYGRTCVVGGHVFQVCAEATIEAAVSLGIWVFLGSWMEKGLVCAQISVPSTFLQNGVACLQDFGTFSSCPEAVVPCRGRISWNTSSEFNFFSGIADRFFFLVNLAGHVQIISASLMW